MKLSDLENEFKPFRNRYDLVTDGHDVDHGILFHGFYFALLERYNLLDLQERYKQAKLLSQFIHPKYPGILLSQPYGQPNTNEHSHDNLKSMFYMCSRLKVTEFNFAANWLAHGRTHKWVWNADEGEVNKFDSHGVMDRFEGMIAQAQIAADETPTLSRQFWLDVGLILSARQDRGRVEKMTLPYFMCKTVEDYNLGTQLAVKYWRSKGLKKYPGGIGEVFAGWGHWKDHPFSSHFKGVIE